MSSLPTRIHDGDTRADAARRAGRPAAVRGFTVVETLITLTMAGVLGAAVLALVLGQNRFYEHSDDSIYAQQSIRAAMDLMASELRMASPTDLLVADPDSVSIRFDVLRAVVCDSTDTDEVTAFVYDSVGNANLPSSFRGTAYSGAYEPTFHYMNGWTPTLGATGGTAGTPGTPGTGSGPMGVCTVLGSPTTGAADDYRELTGWGAQFGDVPDAGSLLRIYGRLTYRFGASAIGSGLAVWRDAQELVSPFQNGARFRYVMDNGTVRNNVSAANFDHVRAIRIDATALGDGSNRYNVQRSISYDVPLRN